MGKNRREHKVATFIERMEKESSEHTVTFEEIIQNTNDLNEKLRLEIPTRENRIEYLIENNMVTKEKIADQCTNTRVFTSPKVLKLMEDFLELKREYGTKIEKEVYKDLTVKSFCTRLLTNRPIIFLNSSDMHMRRDGMGSSGGFDKIGTNKESKELSLKDYISYDEMCIGALLGVSCPINFINSGARNNCARMGGKGSFEPEGVICGMVGARFERYCRMESIFCHVDKDSNKNNEWAPYGANADYTTSRGRLMKLWANFYGMEHFPDYKEAKEDTSEDFFTLKYGYGFFNKRVYQMRMRISIDAFLLEANERAGKAGKKAYVVLVGLGLGMWMRTKVQTDFLLEAHADALRELHLPNIAVVNFCWFPTPENPKQRYGLNSGEDFKGGAGNDINIVFSKADPSQKLKGDYLLVTEFAWDSNAYVGNEYWAGQLAASGDPAAACSCPIPQQMNPLVNPNVSGRTLTAHENKQ